MEITHTVYFSSREEWRKWLSDNFDKAPEIWFIFPKKISGKPAVLYNDAVEEALCFGWIDSTQKRLDEQHTAQRYSPRRPKSGYSQLNKERLRLLSAKGLIHPVVLETVKGIIEEEFVFPPDIMAAIRQDETTWDNYQAFSDSYKRIRIAHIDSARDRPDEFEKRLHNFVKCTRENKVISGYGGTDKYY